MQSFWFINTQSMTYDEPAHIIAGVDAWRHGRFEHWNDHPPLGRLWLTLPIKDLDSNFVWRQMPSGYRIDSMQPGPEEMAARTRPMNTVLGIFLGLALWSAARRLFSEGAANVALALFTFTPSLIANFSVATTDGIGTLFIFLVAHQLIRWRHKPNWLQTVLLSLALGGLLLAKFYAPPLVLFALVLMLMLKPEGYSFRPLQWNWKTNARRFVAGARRALVGLLLPCFALQGQRRSGDRDLSQSRTEDLAYKIAIAPQPHRPRRRILRGTARSRFQ